jgi:ribonucleoside-diphosphate reductase alpha chain
LSLYKELSKERKDLQLKGELPEWITTNSWQMLKEKYLDKGESFSDRIEGIVDAAAFHMDRSRMGNYNYWYERFSRLLWDGLLIPSTPILANMGKEKGCPVACSGGYIPDSVIGFYESQKEAAVLSKNGFGTSGYLGEIRPRGSKISGIRGSASGTLPVFKDFIQVSRDISQGSSRRGAWAGYIEIDHPDFFELLSFISKSPDDANIGWIVSDDFINRLDNNEPDAIDRYQKSLKLKMITGKGYYFFVDKVNKLAPDFYKGSRILASNLCTEIALPSNENESFTCVLSSLNLSKWKEFTSSTIYDSLVFLHCVALEFIRIGSKIEGLEKTVEFTKNHMALGLGTLGFSTYLQDNQIPFESLEAHLWNIEVYKEIDEETRKASQWLAKVFGECKMTKGSGYANTTRIAIAPNLSSSLIGGGVSQGIEPVYKNAYIQGSAAGEMERINPSLLPILKKAGVFNRDTIKEIIKNKGSIQWASWLSDEEKEVFKTAFEIDQFAILRLAASRQRYIDQAQSINLFFSADESELYISSVHKEAFKNKYIKSLYYIRSETGVQTSKGECIACGS